MTRRVLPIALIAVGTIWLLYAVGFVPPSLAAAFSRLWPLLLIAGGLDALAPERRPRDVPFVVFASAVILLAGVFWPAGAALRGPTEVRHDLPTQARHVTFDLRTGSAATRVGPAPDPGTLVAVRFSGEPRATVSVSGGDDARVRVAPERSALDVFGGLSRWEVELPRGLPLDLSVDAGSGPLTLDLVGTRLEALSLDAGSGALSVDLPGGGQPYEVSIDGGSGAIEVDVAPGASLDMYAELGSGATTVFIGEGSDVVLRLETGSGPLELDLPDSAPIRLTVREDGSGPLRLPSFLERRRGSGETGVWESAAMREGGRVIDIVLDEVGSGPITVR